MTAYDEGPTREQVFDDPARDPIPLDTIWPCGAGRDEECCAYLGIVPGVGMACMRETPLASVLRLRVEMEQMGARRLPTEPIPECQTFPDEAPS